MALFSLVLQPCETYQVVLLSHALETILTDQLADRVLGTLSYDNKTNKTIHKPAIKKKSHF